MTYLPVTSLSPWSHLALLYTCVFPVVYEWTRFISRQDVIHTDQTWVFFRVYRCISNFIILGLMFSVLAKIIGLEKTLQKLELYLLTQRSVYCWNPLSYYFLISTSMVWHIWHTVCWCAAEKLFLWTDAPSFQLCIAYFSACWNTINACLYCLQTHDSREHLAIMQRILGPIPHSMIRKTRSVCWYCISVCILKTNWTAVLLVSIGTTS